MLVADQVHCVRRGSAAIPLNVKAGRWVAAPLQSSE